MLTLNRPMRNKGHDLGPMIWENFVRGNPFIFERVLRGKRVKIPEGFNNHKRGICSVLLWVNDGRKRYQGCVQFQAVCLRIGFILQCKY